MKNLILPAYLLATATSLSVIEGHKGCLEYNEEISPMVGYFPWRMTGTWYSQWVVGTYTDTHCE